MVSGIGSHGDEKALSSLGAKPHGMLLVGLSKHYGSVRAVDDVTLDIAPGEFVTLLGPSGSGKTTVLMLIAGFAAPMGGDIVVDGRSILHLLPERRDFGVVFQGYALFPHMTVWENVAYPLKVRKLGREEIVTRVGQALDLVELGALKDRMPKQLSGGQQQRVALARALVFEPKMLLLDEPLGALDKKLRATLQLELRELHARLGATFVNVTHDQEEALTMSDRIAVMREGKVVQVGQPAELFDRPRTRFVADFLGRSNFLPARVVYCGNQHTELDCGGHRLVQGGPALAHHRAGDQVIIALRPSKVQIGNPERATQAGNEFVGVVKSVIFVGTYAQINVETPIHENLVVTMPLGRGAAAPEPGGRVTVFWEPDATVVVDDDAA